MLKRLSATLIVLIMCIGLIPSVYAEDRTWIEINSIDFNGEYTSAKASGKDSEILVDNVNLYNGNPTLKNISTMFSKDAGVSLGGILPERTVGESYKIKATVYMSTLATGVFKGKSKLAIGVGNENNVQMSAQEVQIRNWNEIEFTYTVTEGNSVYDNIIIQRHGNNVPKWFSVANVKVYKSCTPEEAAKISGTAVSWSQYRFDGFEERIDNASKLMMNHGMRMNHNGNSREETIGAEPYEGYSCLNTYTSNNKTENGYIIKNMLPEFTAADIGRRVRVSAYFYIQQLVGNNNSDKVGMQIGICDESETLRNTVKVYAALKRWIKLEGEFEITEENLSFNKILVLFDNGWNYPMWSRLDAVSAEVTQDKEDRDEITLKLDGNAVKTDNPLMVVNDNLMIPAEDMFKAVNTPYTLSEDGKTITAAIGETSSTFKADSTVVDASNRKIFDSIPSKMIDGKLYIPYKEIGVAYDTAVKWDAQKREVDIQTQFPIIRRDVPVSTLTDTKDIRDLHFDIKPKVEMIPWDDLPDYEVVLDDKDFMRSKKAGEGKYGTYKQIEVEGQPFTTAWEVDCTSLPPNAYDFQLEPPMFEEKCEVDDIMLMEFYFRTIKAQHEDGQAVITAKVEANGNGYLKTMSEVLSAGDDWFLVHLPFRVQRLNSLPTIRPAIVFGSRIQKLQIGGFRIVNFKDTVTMDQFDNGTDEKLAIEEVYNPNVQWRNEALDRIEKIRKDDIVVKVVDKRGNPIKDATVDVSMFEHEFKLGTSIHNDTMGHMSEDPDIKTEFDLISKYFNYFVCETAHKWSGYSNGRFAARQLMDQLEKKGVKARYHASIWDAEKNLPIAVRPLVNDKAAIEARIDKHFEAIYDDYGDIRDWDIMNESQFSNLLRTKYGWEVYDDWYEHAYRRLGDGVRYQYNETAHGGGWTEIVDYLEENAPAANSYGIQSHLRFGVIEDRLSIFKDLEDRGLRGMVTEFDIDEDDPILQGGNARDYIIATFASPAMDGLIMWGYEDGYHWLKNSALMNRQDELKPCGEQFVDLFYNKWWTQESGKTGDDGIYSVKGYFGDYDITVTKGGATISTVAHLSRDAENEEIVVVFE